MGRRRKAWLWGGTGKRLDRGRELPGWYVAFNDYSGGCRRGTSRNFLSLKAAREWVRQYNARADLRLIGHVVPVALSEAAEEFIRGCAGLAPTTTALYESAITMLVASVGDKQASTVTGADIDRFIADRLARAGRATAAKHVRSLSRFFNWCVKAAYAVRNPVEQATAPPRGTEKRIRPRVTDAQLGRIVAHLDTEDRRLAVWLGMTTGLDRQVVAGLTPAQVDLQDRCIRIQRPKTRRRTRRTIVAPIHAGLVGALAQRCAGRAPHTPLLVGLTRQAREEDWWHRATTAAGVPDLLFRDLRAVATTRLIRSGVPLPDVQRLLGHSSPEVTEGHYLIPDSALAQKLDSLPLPGRRPPRGN